MSILTENRYYDELNFSSGTIKDEDCADIADWTTDGDTGTGVSSQVFFDSKSCFKMDTVAAGASNVASRTLDIGSYQTNPNVISIKLYHDSLGTLANVDYFELLAYATSYYLGIRWCSDGLYIYDGAAWNEVGTDLVQQDTWQEWTFSWTMQAAGVVDVYLDGVLQASAVDCSTSSGGTTGTTTMRQYGTTVVGLTYIDWFKAGNAMRYGGETWLMQEGGQLTIRTDTRWHANSPASMLGSLGSQTVTEGKLIYDGTDVRWLAYDTGSGNVPAINTSITQGAVTGTLLGVWDTLTSAPTAVGAAMPADGFIKFREVTGGTFSVGALTGIGANATAVDVTGWIEIVADSASTITVPRLGEHEIRGDWFYLDNTNGSVGQQLQVPTNGGGATTYCPGAWIETGVGTDTYEYWPSLAVAADGWSRQHIGGPYGGTDRRQNFLKDAGSGILQIGEASDLSATYANVAAQASTYATLSHSCTYTVVSNVCTVYFSTGHLLKTGAQVGVDFTSGGASALDGTFTITVIDAYYYTFALTTADTSGACTVRPGVTVSFTAHTLGVGDTIYCDATTGTLPDGSYTIYAVTGANAYLIAYPHTANLTSGNVSVYSRYAITYTAHTLAVGNRVYLDFTSGSGVDGIYTIVEVPDANTFRVVMNNGASADSGNVTVKQTIGNVPVSGCKVRIPNVFLREAATATRGTNMVNATIASRPEWATTSAGAIDIEFAYSEWYMNFAQPYSVKLNDCCTYNAIIISECATALDLDNVGVSNISSLALAPLTLTSNFAGGTVQNCKFPRGGAPASSGHSIAVSYCIGTTFSNVTVGGVQFVRSSGYGIGISYGSDITINNLRAINCNGGISLTAVVDVAINDLDMVDRYIGYTNATATSYGVVVGAGCVNVLTDGITFGYGGTIPNVHNFTTLFQSSAGSNIIFRNMGTFDSPLPCGSWRPNLYALGVIYNSGGNNYNLRTQRIYIDDNMRTAPFATTNSDKNMTHESIFGGMYVMSAMTPYLLLDAGLNSVMKGCKTGSSSVTGQASVYGTHFFDMFLGSVYGRYVLLCNEPTADTESYFSMVSGTRKFNSAGGILMGAVGDQATFEDAYFRKGHTGFAPTEMVMSGGTYTNYTVQYQLDSGSGFGTLRNLSYCRTATAGTSGEYTFTLSDATGVEVNDYIFGTGRANVGKVTNIEGNVITSDVANSATVSGTIRFNHLPGETMTPSTGFKLKYQITTIAANLTAVTHIRVETTTTLAAQEDNLYDLDQYTLTLTGLETGTKVAFVETGTETILGSILTESSGSVSFDYADTLVGEGVDIAILAPGFLYQKIVNYTLTSADASIPVVQNVDYGYNDEASATITFNGTTHRIICDTGTTSLDVVGMYTEWVTWALTSNNLGYKAAFSELGGNAIDAGAGTSVPVYGFLTNDWRISPDEADHTLAVTGGVVLVDGGGDPFVDTIGDYTVRINYQQPVQAIMVSTGGGDPWATDLTSYNTANTAGKKLKDTLSTSKFLGLK